MLNLTLKYIVEAVRMKTVYFVAVAALLFQVINNESLNIKFSWDLLKIKRKNNNKNSEKRQLVLDSTFLLYMSF